MKYFIIHSVSKPPQVHSTNKGLQRKENQEEY